MLIIVTFPALDLDLVRCFLAVAESGGFTMASRRLNLSQSAVSLKIQRLESLLGRDVFTRTSRSLHLTAEGEVVLGYARRLLTLNQEMIQRVAQPAIEGILRMGVVQQFGQQFLPDLLSQFKRQHPGVRLCVEVGMTADLITGLEEDRFDLVLGAAGYSPSSTAKADAFAEERIVRREKLVWVQSATSDIDPRLDPVPLILFAAQCAFRRNALEALEKAGRPWQIVYSSASIASIQAAVLADLGIAVFGKSSVLPGMKIIKPSSALPALPEVNFAIYSRPSPAKSLVRSLSQFVSKALARLEGEGEKLVRSAGGKAVAAA